MNKKMIAPIVITALMIIYYILFFAFIIMMTDLVLTILLGVVPLALAGVMIYVCLQRLKEIRSGEDDDLSKY